MCSFPSALRAGAYGETPKARTLERTETWSTAWPLPPSRWSTAPGSTGRGSPRSSPAASKAPTTANLFLEYRQAEMLVFDNGRLKQATYDTSQGFGLRAVKDEAVGYAHASDVSEAAIARAADAVRAVKGGYSGHYAGPPPRTNVKLYGEDSPLGTPGLRHQGAAAGDDRRLCARQGPARAPGLGQPRRHLAGGRDRARRRRDLSRCPPAGARQRLGRGRRRRPAGNRQRRLRRPRRLRSASSSPIPGSTRSTRRCARR